MDAEALSTLVEIGNKLVEAHSRLEGEGKSKLEEAMAQLAVLMTHEALNSLVPRLTNES